MYTSLGLQGKRMLKQHLAEQILSNIIIDTKTHFKLRFLQSLLGEYHSAWDSKSGGMQAYRAGHCKNVPTNLELKL